MGIWIRSQNKRVLVHANAIHEYQGEIFASQNDVSGEGIDSGYAVGRYDTEDKAIIILDMIQNALGYAIERYEPDSGNYVKTASVFQMPEK